VKFLFFLLYDGESASGVNKKIFSQIQSLNALGIDAKLILIGNTGASDTDPPFVVHKQVPQGETRSIFTRIIRARKIAGFIRDYINDLGPSDTLYFRYPLILPFCPINFFKPFRKCIVVFEHNTVLLEEYLLNREYRSFIFECIFGNIVLFQADGGIGMTDEMRDSAWKRIGSWNKPFITNSNGITVDSVRLRSRGLFLANQHISLLCVANFSPWHGIDRLILGLARYSGQCIVTLHLVGNGPMIPSLKQLCRQNNLSDRVIFHDFLSGPDLDRLFDESDIAVGTLAIHRLNLSKSSTLKSREYCSRGIPYVMGSPDPDFPDDFPYILKIPADETAVDMENVITFAYRVCQDPDHPQKMRQYAAEHLDWSIKMKRLKTFLEGRIRKEKSFTDN
jgi:glycosyltransferase involved in cell wall biosynthesis